MQVRRYHCQENDNVIVVDESFSADTALSRIAK